MCKLGKAKNADKYFYTIPSAFYFAYLSMILENYEASLFLLGKFGK